MCKKSDGLEYIELVLNTNLDTVPRPPKIVVDSFHMCGYTINFVVGDRKDRRHGVVDTPAPLSYYAKSMLDAMFRRW